MNADPRPSVSTRLPSIAEAERDGCLILLVEDTPINQDLIKRQLNRLGYAVEVADDGTRAFEMWRHKHYGLVLTDSRMPRMDGYELTRAIRQAEDDLDRPTRIVTITAGDLADEAEKSRAAGADDFLSKPVDLAALKRTLAKWLPVAPSGDEGGDGDPCPTAISGGRERTPKESLGLIDPEVLTRLVGDDPAVHEQLLRKFCREVPAMIEEVRAACRARIATDIGAAAHKLKSSASAVGARTLADRCEALEISGKCGEWHAIADHVQAVEGLFKEVVQFVAGCSADKPRPRPRLNEQ